MVEYVLVSDATLMRDYRNFPLLAFAPCAPTNVFPQFLFEYIGGPPIPDDNGRAVRAPLAVRRIEACLLQESKESQVVVAHPDYVENFIDNDTKIIGVYTMDPKGLGPLTMTFTNGRNSTPIVEAEFTRLMKSINSARNLRAPKAKIVVGGPGSWELWYVQNEIDELGINYIFQGEAEDVAVELFEQLYDGSLGKKFCYGFQSFDEKFHKKLEPDDKGIFVTRTLIGKQFPILDEIPDIRGATMGGLVEVMRGCGIGCDFCEVTLRPSRYFSPERVAREILVNVKHGLENAWLQSDEIFAYQHSHNFVPNEEALTELFDSVMSVASSSNPTHGRISIPAAYPELLEKLSRILKVTKSKPIGIQVGLETGSDELARKHMPNKTLPLKVGPDGSWPEIVRDGLITLDRNHWAPAFTVQVGQLEETAEDNWMTVGMINDLSNADLSFTVTPMINVPLGLLKTKGGFYNLYERLDPSQAAVIYACFRHLTRMAHKSAFMLARGNLLSRAALSAVLVGGAHLVEASIKRTLKKAGLDARKAENQTLSLFN